MATRLILIPNLFRSTLYALLEQPLLDEAIAELMATISLFPS